MPMKERKKEEKKIKICWNCLKPLNGRYKAISTPWGMIYICYPYCQGRKHHEIMWREGKAVLPPVGVEGEELHSSFEDTV